MSSSKHIHYWTGRGTLCSLENSTQQKPNHTSDRAMVTCWYCRNMLALNEDARRARQQS